MIVGLAWEGEGLQGGRQLLVTPLMWKAAVGSLMVGLSSYVDDLCEWFHITEPSSLTWAHAVDSQAELEAADAMFYESDAGALAEDGRVIMCHFPTQTTSDLDLDELLSAVQKRKTGLKIDIKLEKLVGPIGDLLSRVKLDVPVWWNADVFGKKKMPLKALADVATKDTVLSLGYIGTSFGEAERQDIIKQLTDSGLLLPASGDISCRHITFAFSARLALSCTTELVKLLDALPSTSLTLWTGVNDPRGLTRAEELRLSRALPMSRVFLDIKRQTWLGWFASWLEWA